MRIRKLTKLRASPAEPGASIFYQEPSDLFMNTIVNSLVGILRLRSGPQDLPDSWVTTVFIVGLYLALSLFSGQQLGDGDSAAASLAITTLQFAAIAVLLHLRKHPERLAQTLSALAGTGIVLGTLSYMFLAQADPEQQQPLLALAWFSIFFWSLVVDAHIYRHTLSITMPQGMLIAVLLLAASYVLVEFAF